jgi:hypothetical protein
LLMVLMVNFTILIDRVLCGFIWRRHWVFIMRVPAMVEWIVAATRSHAAPAVHSNDDDHDNSSRSNDSNYCHTYSATT